MPKEIKSKAKTSKKSTTKSTKSKTSGAKTSNAKTTKAETSGIKTNKTKASTKSSPLVITFASVALALSVAGFGFSLYNFISDGNVKLNFAMDGNSVNFTEGSIADIASKVAPSVVSIVTETKTSNYLGQSSTANASGTGMIISSDGYVLTNKHVVENANKVGVVLDDGTSYSNVSIIGTDPLNDAAILKINGVDNLTPVKLGDSKTLNIGQQVIAIGNALGQYQNSVTEGIVSGVGRNITAGDSNSNYYESLSDMIQTDAQINSGNSGGPLVNAAGEVIGINTALSASGTAGNSISFAIPISSVKGIINSVIETGKLERPYIGVSYMSITPTLAKTYNLDSNYGAYLGGEEAIISGSPAEKAGLKSGDIITKVNGIEIGKSGSLSTLIGEHKVGENVRLTVLRDNKEFDVSVTLAAYKESAKKVTTTKQ